MKRRLLRKCHAFAALVMSALSLASCDMMKESYDDCPYGLYVKFKYDYNLQRTDMFNGHVGSVTLYVFDQGGQLVQVREESNWGGVMPLADPGYMMHITDLAPGVYKFIAVAGQKPYGEMLKTNRAKFVRTDMTPGSSNMQSLEINLDRQHVEGDLYDIVNNALPLDTLWHGMETGGFEVSETRPTYGVISLMRDTKKINVTLRELDDPTTMDIDDYDLRIIDRNSHILWDNSLDETATVVYTPHDTWNTQDRTEATDPNGDPLDTYGNIGHADFMTSRILWHDDPADDGKLIITNKETGVDVATLDLPDVLSRLRTSEDRYRYSEQEFLDRGYDYQIQIFLRGGKLDYVMIEISVLGWSKRLQREDL